MRIHDLSDDPDFNPSTNRGRGDWSLHDVSQGSVHLGQTLGNAAHMTPHCIDHGAMNAVDPLLSIWRCLTCGRACFCISDNTDTETKKRKGSSW